MKKDLNALPSHSGCEAIITNKRIGNTNISVSQQHCIDSMGPDENGNYEYYYEYDIYFFTDNKQTVNARSYVDEVTQAQFLRLDTGGAERLLETTDFQSDLVKTAAEYLRSIGKHELLWLDSNNKLDGYSAVPN